MEAILQILAVWFIVSVPVSLIVGKILASRSSELPIEYYEEYHAVDSHHEDAA